MSSPEVKPKIKKTEEKTHEEKDKVRGEMNKEIKDLKSFRDKSNKFYEDKIQEVKTLGTKMNQYTPIQQLNKIT